MERSQIVDAYIGRVLEVRREREGEGLTQQELEQIAFESGLSHEDLAAAREEMARSITRGRAFLSYGNWVRAVEEFEQGVALDPNNAEALVLLAHALWNHGVGESDEKAQYRAMQYAERGIQIDPANAAGVKLVTHMTEHPGEPYGGQVGRKGAGPRPVPDPRARKIILGSVSLALLVVGMSMAVFFVAEEPEPEAASPDGLRPPVTARDTEDPGPFATEVAAFGREGTGAGYFTDARSIAVDGAGRLYVGEYSSGRVQVFDTEGNFLTEWNTPSDHVLRGLDVARDGTAYVVRGGEIYRVNGMTGELFGAVEYEQGNDFDEVFVRNDGGLVTAWRGMRRSDGRLEGISSDIVILAPSGLVENVLVAPLESLSGSSSTPRLAVAGDGMIYALDHHSDAVYVFAPDGAYRDTFGESGDEPGQFRAPSDIAITNRGDILVSDIKGIQVFSPNGRYKGLIDVDGAASGIAVDAEDVVWVAVREGVRGMVIGY